ncbi:MAG: hypothetical protein M1465_00320 [Candidatus Marsarchaeota archaeon]|nr:hypothetical protein [Candidatus Marsarchaeota archaeon]
MDSKEIKKEETVATQPGKNTTSMDTAMIAKEDITLLRVGTDASSEQKGDNKKERCGKS